LHFHLHPIYKIYFSKRKNIKFWVFCLLLSWNMRDTGCLSHGTLMMGLSKDIGFLNSNIDKLIFLCQQFNPRKIFANEENSCLKSNLIFITYDTCQEFKANWIYVQYFEWSKLFFHILVWMPNLINNRNIVVSTPCLYLLQLPTSNHHRPSETATPKSVCLNLFFNQ